MKRIGILVVALAAAASTTACVGKGGGLGWNPIDQPVAEIPPVFQHPRWQVGDAIGTIVGDPRGTVADGIVSPRIGGAI